MTNREKYDAFRALYGESDLTRPDHRRFDALVRILLDLPAEDTPALRVGDFVRHAPTGAIVRIADLHLGTTATVVDDVGARAVVYRRDLTPIAAWNRPVNEPPF